MQSLFRRASMRGQILYNEEVRRMKLSFALKTLTGDAGNRGLVMAKPVYRQP